MGLCPNGLMLDLPCKIDFVAELAPPLICPFRSARGHSPEPETALFGLFLPVTASGFCVAVSAYPLFGHFVPPTAITWPFCSAYGHPPESKTLLFGSFVPLTAIASNCRWRHSEIVMGGKHPPDSIRIALEHGLCAAIRAVFPISMSTKERD